MGTAAIDEKEGLLKDENSKFEKAVEQLQATYEELSKTKDENIKAVKESGLGLMKSVLTQQERWEGRALGEASAQIYPAPQLGILHDIGNAIWWPLGSSATQAPTGGCRFRE